MSHLSKVLFSLVILSPVISCTDEHADADPIDTDTGELDPGDGNADAVFSDTQMRTLSVTLAEADLDALNADPAAERYFPATVHFEGLEFKRAAIRYKGSYGSLYSCLEGAWQATIGRDCDKLNFKLKFSEYDDERRFYGLKRLNLHGMDKDYSRIREKVAYRLFREFGLPASRTAYMELRINEAPMGLYLTVEQVDGQFTRARFEDGGKGNLYKEIWFDQTHAEAWIYGLRTNREEFPSVSTAVAMGKELGSVPMAAFKSTLAKWTDVDQLMRYFAVEQTIGHWDSTTAFYCVDFGCFNHNYYLYEYTDREKVALIAWDLDLTLANFGVPNVLADNYNIPPWNDVNAPCDAIDIPWGQSIAPACNPIIRGFATTLIDDYRLATQQLLDTLFRTDIIFPWIEHYRDLIAVAIARDPHGPTEGQWENEIEIFKTHLESLRQRAIDAISD